MGRWGLLLPAAIFLALFYFYPLGSMLQISLARAETGLLGTLGSVFARPDLRKVFGFTVYQAALSTLATLALGLPGAYWLARFRFRGQALLRALTAVPFVLPTLVVAAGFSALLGPRGWINLGLMAALDLEAPPLALTQSLGAIVLAHVFYNTTIVLRLVGDFWSRLDPRLTAAARVLGASRGQAFRQVTLPLLAPAIGAAVLLVFIFDFTSFGVVLVLGGPRFATLETEIYRQTIYLFNLPTAAVLALAQLLCTLALTAVYARLSRQTAVPLNLRAARDTRRPLQSAGERLGAAAMVTVLVGLLVTPMLALALRSVARLEADRGQSGPVQPGLTLAYYRELGVNRRESLFYVPPVTAIWNSMSVAGATVVLALALGLPAAWALASASEAASGPSGMQLPAAALARSALARGDVGAAGGMIDSGNATGPSAGAGRRPAAGRGAALTALDALLMLPLGTSAVTLGLGFIVALDAPPLDLRASPALLPLAHSLVALPFVLRSLAPALRSIRPRLRQAAAVLGASPARVWREIDLPLVGRAVIVAATFAFTISLGEFGATAIIARPEYPTVPVVIYRFIGLPGALNYGQALALSTLLMLVCAGGLLAIERWRIADVGEF
ncbi:MAG: iron ABC transporter permease [Anaerolineales bacterium]|nr:iron ABC transporter permease [Anaerolineales bacterium]